MIGQTMQPNAQYEKSGSIALTGGTLYSIKVEYYENAGDATVYLNWATSGTCLAKQIIPQTQLYPSVLQQQPLPQQQPLLLQPVQPQAQQQPPATTSTSTTSVSTSTTTQQRQLQAQQQLPLPQAQPAQPQLPLQAAHVLRDVTALL